ncbi:hypothetical protein BHE74_00056683 [Ensete ventricosum]|nr:hypothetical protein GW17_00005485 [Ensete ventricosum]RWW38108.1 hypothetical protein BHE74_00056683 [Ensete ventricosum]RZR93978.1 hypothetical protein BHM03_00022580 [Ensete ventricosum]
MSGSSIHPRLTKVIGGQQSIAGSKHNTLYHFWQRSIISTNTIIQKDMRITKLVHISEAHVEQQNVHMPI